VEPETLHVRDWFDQTADHIGAQLQGDEIFTCSFRGEDSEFIRFNRGRVRQAGGVQQHVLRIDLIEGPRHTLGQCTLSGYIDSDRSRLEAFVQRLRQMRRDVPEDPHLHYASVPQNSEEVRPGELAPGHVLAHEVVAAAEGMDLVGILASGPTYAGFANSLGQRNWHEAISFNLDWSAYAHTNKAVKGRFAGSHWDPQALERHMSETRRTLELVKRGERRLVRGGYRVYLAPAALGEILDTLAWGAFGLKSHRTLQTPLIGMIRDNRALHPCVSISENHQGGLAPRFGTCGFINPQRVELISRGRHNGCLVSPRSAREFGQPVNTDYEFPCSLEMAGGELPTEQAAQALGEGLWISDLWYCNFSDRDDCRITGMTRYACCWVEGGVPVAPIEAMRFDESLYRMLGDRLLGLTRERSLLIDPTTYGRRSDTSMYLPGALVDDFRLTL
jgi:predicted Zn-dependent protease